MQLRNTYSTNPHKKLLAKEKKHNIMTLVASVVKRGLPMGCSTRYYKYGAVLRTFLWFPQDKCIDCSAGNWNYTNNYQLLGDKCKTKHAPN